MQLTDILAQMGGLQSMARELGVSETQAENGAAALIPAILGGFKKQAQAQPTAFEGLGGLLGQFNLGSTVVVVAERQLIEWDANRTAGTSIRMGEALGRLQAG